jgi:carbamoyltransferase
LRNGRVPQPGVDAMQGSLLGPEYSNEAIERFLAEIGASYSKVESDEIPSVAAQLLEQGRVVGWFQGRMEFGPRALGARSILGDPRSPTMQRDMNMKIKYREGFRPFAPAVLAEDTKDYFELSASSPYMLLVAPIAESLRAQTSGADAALWGIDRLNEIRSTIPAVTHVDYSARVQTVTPTDNPRFYELLSAWKRLTGCSVLVNTSFNVRGEPIVCSPRDAYACFMTTAIDALVIGDYVLEKARQPEHLGAEYWGSAVRPD